MSRFDISGVFRPPVNGVYSLTVYGIVANNDGGTIAIKKDNTVLCSAWLQYNTIHSTLHSDCGAGWWWISPGHRRQQRPQRT